MFGFPDEDFDSIRDNVTAWNRLGLQVKPFFATPYPGHRVVLHLQGAHPRAVRRRPRSVPARSRRRHQGDRRHLQEVQRRGAVRSARADGEARPSVRIAAYEAEWNRLHGADPSLAAPRARLSRHAKGRSVKIAVVGLGSIGRRHLQNFQAVGVEQPRRPTTPRRPSARRPPAVPVRDRRRDARGRARRRAAASSSARRPSRTWHWPAWRVARGAHS